MRKMRILLYFDYGRNKNERKIVVTFLVPVPYENSIDVWDLPSDGNRSDYPDQINPEVQIRVICYPKGFHIFYM